MHNKKIVFVTEAISVRKARIERGAGWIEGQRQVTGIILSKILSLNAINGLPVSVSNVERERCVKL